MTLKSKTLRIDMELDSIIRKFAKDNDMSFRRASKEIAKVYNKQKRRFIPKF